MYNIKTTLMQILIRSESNVIQNTDNMEFEWYLNF